VYLAQEQAHWTAGSPIKVATKQLLGEAGAAERFLRESVGGSAPPTLSRPSRRCRSAISCCLAMDYHDGRDLAEVVKARGSVAGGAPGSYVLQGGEGFATRLRERHGSPDIKPKIYPRRQKEHP